MRILNDYCICDGLYREVEKVELICKLNQASIEIPEPMPIGAKTFTEEEWYE
jgi:hypothetical protein